MARRRLGHVGDRTGQFAAEAEALDQPQQHHQHARRHAPGGVARQQSHADRAARHYQDRRDEHRPPPVAIAEMAEDDAADRAGEIADREDRERQDERNERIARGKEGRADILGEHRVDDEIVEFERAAEAGEEDDAPLGPAHAGAVW
jgi:hypothetical protein